MLLAEVYQRSSYQNRTRVTRPRYLLLTDLLFFSFGEVVQKGLLSVCSSTYRAPDMDALPSVELPEAIRSLDRLYLLVIWVETLLYGM